MQFLKISTNADALPSGGGSKYISKSGIYDVTIKFASIDVSTNGAQSINFNIEYNGNTQTIYGPYITSTKGDSLKIVTQLVNSLGIIAGLGEDDALTIEQEEHAVGKDNTVKEFNVIPQFSDLEVKMRIQEEYSINPKTNEIRKSLVPRAFYRINDGASVREIVNNTEAGVQLEKDLASYATAVTYNDGLDADKIKEWEESKSSDSAKPTAPKAAIKPAGSVFKKS